MRLYLFAAEQVDGGQRLGEGRDRLEGAAHDDRFAVGHAAFEATGAVGLAAPLAAIPLVRRHDDVVGLRAGAGSDGEPAADVDALRGVDAHHGLRDLAVELAVPLDVGAEADRHTGGPHLEGASQGVTGLTRFVDGGNHALARFAVGAANSRGLDGVPVGLAVDLRDDVADRCSVRVDSNAELLEKPPADGSDRDARGGFAGGGAFEDVADVVEAVLHRAGEVGVAGAQACDALGVSLVRADLHDFAPVVPDAVGDNHRDGAAQRAAVADAADELGVVLLQLLALRAAVAALAPLHLDGDVLLGDGHAGRDALKDGDERLSVRFAGGKETQLCHDRASAAVALLGSSFSSSSGAGGGATVIASGRPASLRR